MDFNSNISSFDNIFDIFSIALSKIIVNESFNLKNDFFHLFFPSLNGIIEVQNSRYKFHSTTLGARKMFKGLYTATSGMMASERKQQFLTNNLSNAETPGFKHDEATLRPSLNT